MSSSSSSSSTGRTSTKTPYGESKEDNKYETLWKWSTHQNESYHYFTSDEAQEIRTSLLNWYRKNRRGLPWRGDAGPFDGSTAGIASNSSSSNKKRLKKNDSSQKAITSFLTKNSTTSNITKTKAYATSRPNTRSRSTNKINDSVIIEEKKDNNSNDASNEMMKDCKEERILVTGYSVWVSEIMLQQTRVEAVIPYYLKWMKKFPTVYDLANATDDEVNSHWAGLGFYRRARLLHKGAKFVVNELDGTIPTHVDDLMKIDGIGKYTASAIASIAFNTCVPVVDGNVCRVLSRLKGIANHIKAPVFKDQIGWKLAEQIVQAGDGLYAGEVNQAMMELGATYCAPSGTGTDENDPLTKFYLSTKLGRDIFDLVQSSSSNHNDCDNHLTIHEFELNSSAIRDNHAKKCKLCDLEGISSVLSQIRQDIDDDVCMKDPAIIGHSNFPLNPPKKTKREEVLTIAAMSINFDVNDIDTGEKWLMVKRPKDGLLAGQWEFPVSYIWSSADANDDIKGEKGRSKRKQPGGVIEVPTFSLEERQNATMKSLQKYIFESNDSRGGDRSISAAHLWSRTRGKRMVVTNDTPMEHIFSHVRHSMWIEYCEVIPSTAKIQDLADVTFTLPDGREYKWMNIVEMNNVGVTSAIKKVLAAVKKIRNTKSKRVKKR